jgi:2-hydroxy-3-oxopropionate reductase
VNFSPVTAGSRVVLPHTDVLVLNEAEAAALRGQVIGTEQAPPTDLEETMDLLRRCDGGPRDVAVTLGERGPCGMSRTGEVRQFRAHEVVTVNAVGAGDSFLAMLVSRLAQGEAFLIVWNRTSARAAVLERACARVAASPAEAAAPVTLSVLTDLAEVEEVLGGEKGLIAGWTAAGVQRPVLVVHGTVSPVGVAALARRLAEGGIDVVDAPLSGGVAGAESGALSVMVGGDEEAVSRVWPVLSLVGSTVRHLGPSGSGQTAKACNQVVVAATVTALAEALVLADASGISRTDLLELLGGGLADSEVLRQKRDRCLAGDFRGGGSAINQLKDLRFVAEAASARGVRLPVATTLRTVFENVIADGDGDLDHAGVELSLARHSSDQR